MAIGSTVYNAVGGLVSGAVHFFRAALNGGTIHPPGSVDTDWVVANSDASTANSTTEQLYPASIDDSTVTPIKIPPGATSVLFRLRCPITGTLTTTTAPVIKPIVTDQAGVPMRIDTTDCDGAGQTLNMGSASNVMRDANYYYGDVLTLSGYDMQCCGGLLYVTVSTAAVITDGTNPIAAAVMVKFRN